MTENAVIEIKELNKWYGHFHVLKNINLTVRQGERIVICGPSGSGKFRILTCLFQVAFGYNCASIYAISSISIAVEVLFSISSNLGLGPSKISS